MLEEVLTPAGHEVARAYNGMQAMRILSEVAIDAVLLDVRMPVVNGWQTLKMIRSDERLHAIPVIMLSAYGSDVQRSRALSLGCNEFLEKPVSPDGLVSALEAALRPRRARAPRLAGGAILRSMT
jgi:CheY-like chemotaxis protein